MENTKIYIGKAKQVKNFDLYNVTINLSKIKDHIFKAESGDEFISFSLAKTKEVDRFGKTHTAYIQPKPVMAEESKPKSKKSSKKKAAPKNDYSELPF